MKYGKHSPPPTPKCFYILHDYKRNAGGLWSMVNIPPTPKCFYILDVYKRNAGGLWNMVNIPPNSQMFLYST